MEKTNIKLIMKRVVAYMIDIVLVTIFASFLSTVPELKTEYDKYQKVYDEYSLLLNEYTNLNIKLNDLYEDKTISNEEYNELIEVERYSSIIKEKYQDQIIEETELKEITEKISQKFEKISEDYNYKMQKIGSFNLIITLACTLLYFGVFQYFYKGKTIGKQIMNLQVVAIPNKKINILNYILRSLIINNVLLNSINVAFLILSNKETFYMVDNLVSLSISMIEAITIFLLLTREDSRGLHDIICNTKVISTK